MNVKKAVKLGKRSTFKNDVATVRAGIDNLGQELIDIYDDHISNMQSCASSDACNGVRQAFTKEYNRLSDELEDLALDVFELSCKYDVDKNLVSEKDTLLKTLSERFRELDSFVFSVSQKIEKEINDYKDLVSDNPSPDSSQYKDLISMQSAVNQFNDDIHKENNYISCIQNASSKDELEEMKESFLQKTQWLESINY